MNAYFPKVIGAGTAGATIAARLAAQPGVSVAVIEAGGFYEQDNGNASQIPGYSSNYMTFNDLKPQPLLVDWQLITEPQTVCPCSSSVRMRTFWYRLTLHRVSMEGDFTIPLARPWVEGELAANGLN